MIVLAVVVALVALVLFGDWLWANRQRRQLAAGAPAAANFDSKRDSSTNIQIVEQSSNSIRNTTSGGFGI